MKMILILLFLSDFGLPCHKMKKNFLLSKAFNVYNMEVLEHFETKNYAFRLDIVQKFSCLKFRHFLPKYISKNISRKRQMSKCRK